jgi:hypothetical protein
MTRHEMIIHMVCSQQRWPTEIHAPVPMVRAFRGANVLSSTMENSAITSANTTSDTLELTTVAVSGDHPEAPFHKTP